ncbi:hypothetical protein Taro_021003 [Colocasia esculenta]|uniref:Uncharacterized protein n=1 Tax=Colocasia esculenta TaxID=4460 RepID=A0A843UXT6_COLES|nr:hypothetical protein [Colocasia esculenta]
MGQAIRSRNLRKSGFLVVSRVWTKTSVAEGEPILGEAQEVPLKAVAAESEGPSAVAEPATREAATPSASLEVAINSEVAMETPVAEEIVAVANSVRRSEDPLPTSSVASALRQVLDSIPSFQVGEQGSFLKDAPIQGEQNIEIEPTSQEALTEGAPVNAGHNEAPIEVKEQVEKGSPSKKTAHKRQKKFLKKMHLKPILKRLNDQGAVLDSLNSAAVGPKDPTPQERKPSGPSEVNEVPSGPSVVAPTGPSGPSVEVQPSKKVPSKDSVLCQESGPEKESLNPVDPVADQEDQVDFATLDIPDVVFLLPRHALIMDSSVGTLIFERAARIKGNYISKGLLPPWDHPIKLKLGPFKPSLKSRNARHSLLSGALAPCYPLLITYL